MMKYALKKRKYMAEKQASTWRQWMKFGIENRMLVNDDIRLPYRALCTDLNTAGPRALFSAVHYHCDC